MSLNAEIVKAALERVSDPVTGRDVVSSGLISGITLRDGYVGFVITIDLKDKTAKAHLPEACEEAVKKIPGVTKVSVVMTAQSEPSAAAKPAQWNLSPVEGVKKIIAVASGKGGVGKSTTAVNLALAFARKGLRVGLLDADIYGPSIPLLMGISTRPEIKDDKMLPPVAHGIECMSIGFITGDQAAVMRGPMISKTLTQLLRSTRWGNLDVLLVDMPPGTGDVQLSMAQACAMAAVIVTTPQQVALIDARKAASMFAKTHVPVLGVIENMSGGIFGSGGGKILANECGVPFLGTVPMDGALVQATDHGKPYAGELTRVYDAIVATL